MNLGQEIFIPAAGALVAVINWLAFFWIPKKNAAGLTTLFSGIISIVAGILQIRLRLITTNALNGK